MRDLLNAAEMKAVDQRSIEEYGIPSLVLMERAALEVVKRARELLEPGLSGNEALEHGPGRERLLKERKRKTVWAVCGLGNNGADGAAAARMLTLQGFSSVILLPSLEGKRSRELEVQLSIAEKLGIPILTLGDPLPEACDLILDAVFGIGLSRPVEGVYKELIGLMEEKRQRELVPVAAVDMPSGISSDTGAVMGCAVKADVTVTFGMRKVGQALFPGREYCGRLFVEDVGFVPEDPEQAGEHVHAHGPEDLMEIPRRRADSHKGTYGKILVIAGAKNMAGAAYFSALAAYRTGAGLVKIMTVEENRSVIQERLPEAVLSSFDPQWASEEPGEFKEYIRSQTGWADAIVLGPGLGGGVCQDTGGGSLKRRLCAHPHGRRRGEPGCQISVSEGVFYRKYHSDAPCAGIFPADGKAGGGDQGGSPGSGQGVFGPVRRHLRFEGCGHGDGQKGRKAVYKLKRLSGHGQGRIRGCADRGHCGTFSHGNGRLRGGVPGRLCPWAGRRSG